MGFNIKANEDGKEYNLNLSYNRIIKPVLEFYNLDYIRADEIMMAEMIDDSLYNFLLSADLVIADITTLNPNALYELGVRYALKPYSTIIIGSDDTIIPFDLSHLRVFKYKHNGFEISNDECKKLITTLKGVIKNILDNFPPIVDSPVYKVLSNLNPPKYAEDTNYFENNIHRFKSCESFGNLIHIAYKEREIGHFSEAIGIYKKALKISKDDYVIKEIAVCIYQQDTFEAYRDALNFLKEHLNINQTLNPEILKTLGTIYKNLWLKQRIPEFATKALRYYEKSFVLLNTYNSGLNYGFMLLVLSSMNVEETRTKYLLWSKHIYEKTKKICMEKYDVNDYWVNASLSECCLVLGEMSEYKKYQQISSLCISTNVEQMQWKLNKTKKQLDIIQQLLNDILC